jgi:hypothetical protein
MSAREVVTQFLPWLLSILSLAMSVLTGNRWQRVWLFGLLIQCLWLLWIWASGAYGFLPLTLPLFGIYWRNHLKWEKERRHENTGS